MVTAVAALPAVGVKLVIASAVVTVNGSVEVADPAELLTEIVPVVAPAGTATTRLVAVAELTTAPMPLKVTVFRLAVGLKPLPEIVTVAPTGPLFGANVAIETVFAAGRLIAMILPAASYWYCATLPSAATT